MGCISLQIHTSLAALRLAGRTLVGTIALETYLCTNASIVAGPAVSQVFAQICFTTIQIADITIPITDVTGA